MKIAFVVHQLLKNKDQLKKRILDTFEADFDLTFYETNAQSGAMLPTRQAIKAGAAFVVVAGGDGSVNEAVNGYMQTSALAQSNTALGVLPMGTGNDFVRSLGLTQNLQQLRTLIEQRSIWAIDICQMDYQGPKDNKESRFFVNIADVGIGGQVAQYLQGKQRRFGGNFTYIKSVVWSFFSYKKQELAITSPYYNKSGKVLTFCMANARYFASGLCIAPEARLDDGLMQLTFLGKVSLFDYFRNLPKLKKGKKLKHKDVFYASASELSVVTKQGKSPVEMDGEFVGYTPLSVKVIPQVVNILATDEAKSF